MEGEFIFLFLTITVVVGSWVPTSPQPAFNCNLQVQRFENLLSKHGCSSELQLNRMKRDDDDDGDCKKKLRNQSRQCHQIQAKERAAKLSM